MISKVTVRRGEASEMASTYKSILILTFCLQKNPFVTSVIFCPFLAKTLMCVTISTAHSHIVMR